MTTDEIVQLVQQYRAGLDAELTLLRQLVDVSHRQQRVTRDRDFRAFEAAGDERDRLMQSLVTIEAGLREVRQQLAAHRELLVHIRDFDDVVAVHREAAGLVSAILSTDRESLAALADAELARRASVASIERGESTLAAYRRVLTPPATSATLVDRRG